MQQFILALVLVAGLISHGNVTGAGDFGAPGDEESVKRVISESYIRGVITESNVSLMEKGWHKDCDILYFKDNEIMKYPIVAFKKRISERSGPIETDVKYEFQKVMVQGYAAMAVVKVWYKGKPKYMDFLSLYKFDDGWKIVTKIYYSYKPQAVGEKKDR